MLSKKNMNVSPEILFAVGIVIGVVVAMMYNYMKNSKENLDVTIVPDVPDISPEEEQKILDGNLSDFLDWIDKNIAENANVKKME